ncbi:MAG: uracil-DNA glycosylase [Spirochaetaceae bacterium]|nr:uracil-DNA glycosylase [Spirochaetaceae bacterium]
MTEKQQAGLARFLDTAYGFLKAGYFEEPTEYDFSGADSNGAGPCTDLGGSPQPCAGVGGRVGGAAVSRRQSGNSAPLMEPESLDTVADSVRGCTLCGLHATRIKAVPGEGARRPLALVVGEGPGADEDSSGRPFVGAAGRLLDQMLASIGLDRNRNCFIANVVKCRPPGNRDPLPAETAACLPFFERQLALLRPLVILTVGKVPVKTLLGTDEGITRLRGNWKSYRGIPLLPSFHPSYLLRDASQKKFAWEDLKALCRRLAELDAGYAAETAELRRARGI